MKLNPFYIQAKWPMETALIAYISLTVQPFMIKKREDFSLSFKNIDHDG